MDVKEILRLAAIFTDQKDLLEDGYFLTQMPPDYQACEQRQEKINQLLSCLNLVYDEITTEYLPSVMLEEVVFFNNIYSLLGLTYTVLNVREVRNKQGKKVKFKIFSNAIFCNLEEGTIIYEFVPSKLSLNSKIFINGGKVPVRVFAYGVAMEYYFLQTLSTEALIWENRYRNSLLTVSKTKRNIILPVRRWI